MPAQNPARHLSETYLADLRTRVRLVDIAADYVDLKPAGAGRLKGLCPFHSERTPSFFVSVDWNRYHCFGCGADGDTLAFLMDVDGLRFRDAVADLAARAGMEPPGAADPGEDADRQRRTDLYAVLDAAATQMHHWLLEHPDARVARDFLRSRAFDSSHAADWQIGYCPPGGALAAHLTRSGHPRDALVAAGLLKEGSHGPYDVFQGRIVWPLRDAKGRAVGFTGRDLSGRARAKYLNSSETDVFRKSSLLYGLDRARHQMLRTRQVIVVEGQTDVMAMHAAGHTNTVAASGTAVSATQAELLASRIGDDGEIVTAFDHDDAGRKAAWSMFLACQGFTSRISAVSFAGFGDKADACQVRIDAGDAALGRLFEHREPLLQVLLRADIAAAGTDSPEQKVAATRAVQARLRQVQSAVLRREYTQLTADWIGVDTADTHTPAPAAPAGTATPSGAATPDAVGEGELQLAMRLLDEPHLIGVLPGADLYGVFGQALADIVSAGTSMFRDGRPHSGPDAELWAEAMGEVAGADGQQLLWQLAFTDPLPPADVPATAERLRLRQLQARHRRLQQQISGGDSGAAILADFADVTRALRAAR